MTRRGFLRRLPAVIAAVALVPRGHAIATSRSEAHPEPRPGIDGSNVLTADDLSHAEYAIPAYDAVREIPDIADGIRCYCGCANLPGYRSLLTCFEDGGMAMSCDICMGQALLAHGRRGEGQSLEQIRRAIDARYAPPGRKR